MCERAVRLSRADDTQFTLFFRGRHLGDTWGCEDLRMELQQTSWLGRVAAADARVLAWVTERRARGLVAMMRMVTRTGDAICVVLALLASLVLWPGRASASVSLAAASALLAFSLLKRACRRARPSRALALLPAPDCFSLPSGHAAGAFAVAVSLAVVLPWLAPLAIAWALAVGASRVVLGVHYPMDVVVGALLGMLAAGAVQLM